MEDLVFVFDLDDRPVGKDALHAFRENLPLHAAMEVIAHEKSTAQQVLAQSFRLRVGQVPMAHLHSVKPRPMENVVTIVEVDRLFDGTGMDACQPAERLREVPVRTRIVDGPVGSAASPVAAVPAPTPPS